jgi:subtilisin family serine protease
MLAIAGALVFTGAGSLVLTAAASVPHDGANRSAIGAPFSLDARLPLLRSDDDNGNPKDDGDDDGDDDISPRTVEVRGEVITVPVGFEGDWIIATGKQTTQTVRVDAKTDIRKFEGVLPVPSDYIEARGTLLADNVLLARRIRPDNVEAEQLVVRLSPEADLAVFVEKYDLEIIQEMPLTADTYLFRTTGDEKLVRGQIISDPWTIWAEFNFVSHIPIGNPYRTWEWGGREATGYLNQSAFALVNALPGQTQYTGEGVLVAVLDTGVDLEHPVFAGMLEILPGSDMISPTTTPDDEGPGSGWGHGTHVAGIIRQIAPGSRIIPVRVLDSNGRGNSFDLAYAIEWAAAQGADVLNLSLGADCDSEVLSSAVQSAIDQQVIVVAAAGNAATEDAQCPAGSPGVISVTAIDANRVKAPFANYGSWVTLAAPGIGITSTIPISSGEQPDHLYAAWSGTSMATPFVSAAAALVRQKLAASQPLSVSLMLQENATSIDEENPDYSGKVGRLLDVGSTLAGGTGEQPEVQPVPTQLFLPAVRRN